MIAMVFKTCGRMITAVVKNSGRIMIVIASDKMIAPMVKIKGSMIALERDDCKLRTTDPFLFNKESFIPQVPA